MDDHRFRYPQHTALYKILEIPVTAPYSQIRKSFHKIAQKICPDRHVNNPDWLAINERFAYLIFAHEILKKPETRAVYDAKGFGGLRTVGISIPAGFSNYQDTLSAANAVVTPSPLKTKSAYNKDASRRAQVEQQIRSEKAREFQPHKTVDDDWRKTFRFAAYKQVVKIAWRKELMSEFRR